MAQINRVIDIRRYSSNQYEKLNVILETCNPSNPFYSYDMF